MAKQGSIRVYDYVNHPYETVRKVLSEEAETIFRNATKTAALRAQDVSSELHVNISGFDVGTDITISVNKIEDVAKTPHSPATTRLHLEWEATNMPPAFSFYEGGVVGLSADEHGDATRPFGKL